MNPRLKLQFPDGSDVALLRIEGNPRRPEPAHVRIVFPGGNVEVTRATEGPGADYWVHIQVDRPESPWFVRGETETARIIDARLDAEDGKGAAERDLGDFRNAQLYHVALRIHRTPGDDLSTAHFTRARTNEDEQRPLWEIP